MAVSRSLSQVCQPILISAPKHNASASNSNSRCILTSTLVLAPDKSFGQQAGFRGCQGAGTGDPRQPLADVNQPPIQQPGS
eukprot:3872414-Prymnesium_polylepis.1